MAPYLLLVVIGAFDAHSMEVRRRGRHGAADPRGILALGRIPTPPCWRVSLDHRLQSFGKPLEQPVADKVLSYMSLRSFTLQSPIDACIWLWIPSTTGTSMCSIEEGSRSASGGSDALQLDLERRRRLIQQVRPTARTQSSRFQFITGQHFLLIFIILTIFRSIISYFLPQTFSPL
ncbi:unnamed protein product [Macrosiphum euphorbiae]|uniref:Uncharacterized protein n=1 Tax=Macrosiphum euphorbiae TaxID=13131 RepID=A0AAV0XXD8_9HEMI|nr:unnamed protein product [Macrosiphum euphorbiae]